MYTTNCFKFSDIPHAIYTSKWYQNSASVQKMMLLIMLRSQRAEYFSGAGLLNINIDAFGSVSGGYFLQIFPLIDLRF